MGVLRGEAHPLAKLTDSQILEIRELWNMGHRNVRVMARRHGVSSSNIMKIVRKQSWTHL